MKNDALNIDLNLSLELFTGHAGQYFHKRNALLRRKSNIQKLINHIIYIVYSASIANQYGEAAQQKQFSYQNT